MTIPVHPAAARCFRVGDHIALGILTLTGGLTDHSIYDRLYNATIRRILRTAAVPEHGAPRRFGCAIGGIMYTASGVGFLAGNARVAFVPALFMVTFATIAGLTQWCFASALHSWIFARKSMTADDQAREAEASKPAGPRC